MRVLSRLALSVLSGSLIAAAPAAAQIDARMLRQPDVSATQIAFVYAGDIWVVPKQGGVAVRLSSPRGEESFPRFSPDGTKLAYSAQLRRQHRRLRRARAGRRSVAPDLAPDDRSRARLASRRHARAVRVVARERPAALQPVLPGRRRRRPGREAAGARTASSAPTRPTASSSPTCRSRRTSAPGSAIAAAGRPTSGLFDLATRASANVTASDANDEQPMWHGDTLYFLSDRGANQRDNIWARDKGGALRQVTQFADFDITFPSLGPDDIVFQAGGRLYLLDLATEKATRGRRSRSSPTGRRSSRAPRRSTS